MNLGVCDHESNVDCINEVEIKPDVRDPPEYSNQLGVTIPGNLLLDFIENNCLVDEICPADAMIEHDCLLEHIKYQFYMQYISFD